MPRPTTLPQSSLRNRNRVTNKTRLKVYHGNVNADLLIPDEDEEKARLLQSVAGVDLEDANEHHLQAVLSESAARRSRETQAAEKNAFIPTPDSTGVVDNYADLYPSSRWVDPTSYLKFSRTVEECVSAALAYECTYYMDERDKEWLDKTNEEARGEGTSAQASIAAATRVSSRATKGKGKEPEPNTPISISEDEFELVMGLFELVTHEKTEFLHHGFDNKTFPSFAVYQDVFSNPLSPHMFAKFGPPTWLPEPSHLVKLARIIYSYWKERRTERKGQRIIPIVNGDETDTLNESYVCFRRREMKTTRKLRNSQTSVPTRFTRFVEEWEFPEQLLQGIVHREKIKREHLVQSANITAMRLEMLDIARRNPGFAEKRDEELLLDRERVSKRQNDVRRQGTRYPSTRTDTGLPLPNITPDPVQRPKTLLANIAQKTEAELVRRKEKDREWEDVLDYAYQAMPASGPARAFKMILPLDSSDSNGSPFTRAPRSVRMRFGRGGRTMVDRRMPISRPTHLTRSRRATAEESDDEDEDEATRRLVERWRFDSDGIPGVEEQDRTLVDEYSSDYMGFIVGVPAQNDLLATDSTIHKHYHDGRQESVPVFPFLARREMPPQLTHLQQQQRVMQISQAAQQQHLLNGASSLPHIKQAPSNAQPLHTRISNGGLQGQTTTATAPVNSLQAAPLPADTPSGASTSPIQATPSHAPPIQNGNSNTVSHHVSPPQPISSAPRITVSGASYAPSGGVGQQARSENLFSTPTNFIQRPKSQTQTQQQPALPVNNPNGYYPAIKTQPSGQSGTPMSAQLAAMRNTYSKQRAAALIKPTVQAPAAFTNFNVPLANGSAMNLKLPPQRQLQWDSAGQPRGSNPQATENVQVHTMTIPLRSGSGNGGQASPPPPQQSSPRSQAPAHSPSLQYQQPQPVPHTESY